MGLQWQLSRSAARIEQPEDQNKNSFLVPLLIPGFPFLLHLLLFSPAPTLTRHAAGEDTNTNILVTVPSTFLIQ